MGKTAFFVYILECRNGSYYTGITVDIAQRLRAHAGGVRGAKYTRAFPPRRLAAVWRLPDRSSASRLERFIKNHLPAEKKQFVQDAFKLRECWRRQGGERLGFRRVLNSRIKRWQQVLPTD